MRSLKNNVTSWTQNLVNGLSKKKLNKTPLIKTKILGKKNISGKNNMGKITVYHKGGGHKKKYRKIDFIRNDDSIGIITSIEYDPYRTALIASVYNILNAKYFYIVAPKNIKIGSIVNSGIYADIKVGHCLPIRKISAGAFIHNVCVTIKKKAQLVRAAGTYAKIISTTAKYCRILLNSGKHKLILLDCLATIGAVSKKSLVLKKKKKAGRNRWLNIRPTVRGVAMNSIDHPHGGGEGKTSGGKYLMTPWGKPFKKKRFSKDKTKNYYVKTKELKC